MWRFGFGIDNGCVQFKIAREAKGIVARMKLSSIFNWRWLFLAARGDAFWEQAAKLDDLQQAARIFWPGDWVSSATGTIDLQIMDGLLARIEYRHDHGQANMFFSELDASTPAGLPITPILNSQDTLALGILAWF